MKQRIKRILACMLAIVAAFTAVFSNVTPAMAVSAEAALSYWDASAKDVGEVSEIKPDFYHGKILYGLIDGHSAYCMNFGLQAYGGQLMNSYENASTSMTAKQEKLLAYCMYFGYSAPDTNTPSSSQNDQFIATQSMVWIIEADLFNTNEGDSAAKKLCDSAPDADAAYKYYKKLKSDMLLSFEAARPSFASQTKSGANTYVLKWNESKARFEYTFTDENKVLSNFDFDVSGFSITKNGNTMTVYTDKVNTTGATGTFTSNIGQVDTTTGCVYWLTGKEGYQEFVSEQPQADPITAYIKVKTENIGYGEITKTDKSTGKHLAGAVYGIYSDSSCKTLVDTMKTDKNGYAKSKALGAGTYYVKEIDAPNGYVRSNKVHTLMIKAGQTKEIELTDVEQKGSLTIYKEGEVLIGWNGSNFTYEKRKLAGAEFKVTAGADIYCADGTKAYNKGDIVSEGLVTGKDGNAVLSDLHLGTYIVTETRSIDGYTVNGKPKTVTIVYEHQDKTVEYVSTTILNARQKAEVSVIKKDEDTENGLSGGKYTLYADNNIRNYDGKVIVTKGTTLQEITTGAGGKGVYSLDLPVNNNFVIKETQAPANYYRNSKATYSFTFKSMTQDKAKATFSHTFKNKRTTAKIRVTKVDAEIGKQVPQGDALLKGAVYGLYARENIVHPDGVTGVLFKKNELVATLTTDDKGMADIADLYLGKYYVKEISPSEGYLLDETEYDIVCDYEGDMIPQVLRDAKSRERVIKQPFQLIKVSDDGKDTEADLLSGAGFTAYLKSALGKKTDGSYDFVNSKPVVVGKNGATTIYTDAKGYACSLPLPYGTYVVVESVTPHNMETIRPFEVTIRENKPSEPQVWRVFFDREFSAKLRIIKKDSDTGKTVLIPNTEFKIYNMDKKEYVTMVTTYPSKVTHKSFFTDDDGDLILPDVLSVGNYRIEEVSAPQGYILNKNYVEIAVDSDTFYEVYSDTYEAIITIEYEDTPAKGELTVVKQGEILDGYKGGLFADTEEKTFAYKEENLAGAEFEVYAAEDVYTADMQLDEYGNRTKYYSAGDFVATMITGGDGKAVLRDLPLGKYKIVETKAPFGYVLNAAEQVVTFRYVDENTPVVCEKVTFSDDRQKFSLIVKKLDEENGDVIPGAEFGLYAEQDITNAAGKVIVEKETLLETAVSDAYGVVTFTKDYPFAKYYAKELKAPAGYVSSDEIVHYVPEYQGMNVPTFAIQNDFVNTPTSFEFTKTDITSGIELGGATLSVIDKDGNIVDTWTSEAGKKHVIKKLVVGETYTLREEFAPYGYLKATDVKFTVEDSKSIQKVVMKDAVPTGSIVVNKDGEFITDASIVKGHWYDFIFKYFKKSLAGVTYEVYAQDDVVSLDGLNTAYYKAGDRVATIVTDNSGIAKIDNLPLGRYYLVESATIDGFVLDSNPIYADLSYVNQDTKIVYAGMNVTNERQKVQVTVIKKDHATKKHLSGAEFGLYAKEDIKNSDGKIVIAAGTQIEKIVTGEDGTAAFVSDLPLGWYYVKEIKAPAGYVKSDETIEVDATYKGSDVKVIEVKAEFENDTTKAEFTKTDITGEKELSGAHLSIIDSEGKVIEYWTSEAGKAHYVEKLPVGKYILHEESAPLGYKIARDVKFEITETSDIQKVTMKDDYMTGCIVIDKKDVNTKKPIAGVEFEIRDKDGKVIETLTTDKDGHAESKELPVCIYGSDGSYKEYIHYFVVETKAVAGYILDDTKHDVVFKSDGRNTDSLVYTLDLTNKPDKPGLPQTGDDFNPWMFAGVGLSSIALGLFLFIRKRKDDKAEA